MSSPRRITRPNSRLHGASAAANRPDREEAIRRALKKRRRRRVINFFLLLGIATAIGLFIWAEQNRRSALSQLEAKESELEQFTGTPGGGMTEEEADQILEKVGKLMVLPKDPKPRVATIINVSDLRLTSDFYNQAENGDILIITDHRAILYDPERGIIVDVVPLQKVEATESPPPAIEPAPAAVEEEPAVPAETPPLEAAAPEDETPPDPSPVQ